MKFLFLGLLLLSSIGQSLEKIKADHVQVSWLAPEKFGSGAETIGIYFQMDPGWHIYWKNPGDSGAAPKFQFSKTNDLQISAMSWPFPQRATSIKYRSCRSKSKRTR